MSSVVLLMLVLKIPLVYPLSNFNFDYKGNSGIVECDILLSKLATSASKFTMCSLYYSRPIRVCEKCFHEYYEFSNNYTAITNTSVNGTTCKDILLNVDRLEIVETFHKNLESIWHRGSCDKCLTTNGDSRIISNETKTFFEHLEKTRMCIKNQTVLNKTDEITCKDCMVDYLTLNSFYESLKGSSETTEICVDIVDSMNATRSIWSSVLKCCKLRQSPEIIFLLCTALISVTPLIFYLLARFYSHGTIPKVMEQNRLCETFPDHNQEGDEQSEQIS